MMPPVDPGLDVLLTALAAGPGPAPETDPDPFAPGAFSLEEDWLAAVRRARAAADARAVAAAERLERLSAELLGATARELLGGAPSNLAVATAQVEVPVGAQLDDLLPELSGLVPHGPAPVGALPRRARVPARVTAPAGPRGTVIRLHGGGFWMGGGAVRERLDDLLVATVAQRARVAVVDLDYRLAPEHPYPAAVVDTLAALEAVEGGRLGAPGGPVVLLGTSSGASTAAIAAMARARAGRAGIAALALIVPSLDLTTGPESLLSNRGLWERRIRQLGMYAGDWSAMSSPWVSPARAAALAGMPPCLVVDARRDDVAMGGKAFAETLQRSGVRAERLVLDMTHTVATPRAQARIIEEVAAFTGAAVGA